MVKAKRLRRGYASLDNARCGEYLSSWSDFPIFLKQPRDAFHQWDTAF